MKFLLCVLLLASSLATISVADEFPAPENKSESNITSGTKKVLRKVGRKSMDTTCELTKSKEECAKEKSEHDKAAAVDAADTERRKAEKQAEKQAKKEAKAERRAEQKIEEQECHNVDGKIQCAGKKIKNKVKNVVE